jgi:hypothetical protein
MNATDSPAVARLRKNLRYASDFPSGHVEEVEAVLAELDRLRATVIALEAPQEARLSTESSSDRRGGPATERAPSPRRQHAVVVRRTHTDLEAERAALLARVDGCTDLDCPHHGADVARLDDVAWLLNPTNHGEAR